MVIRRFIQGLLERLGIRQPEGIAEPQPEVPDEELESEIGDAEPQEAEDVSEPEPEEAEEISEPEVAPEEVAEPEIEDLDRDGAIRAIAHGEVNIATASTAEVAVDDVPLDLRASAVA